jgi:putative oxidoreductase
MGTINAGLDRLYAVLGSRCSESFILLFVRISLAGIFWRSGRTKVVEGSWLQLSETTRFLFEEEYSGVPLPPEFAAHAATWAEHIFPVLLVLGLATRFSAFALLCMTMVIQIFVFPEAWWSVHMVWVSLCLILIVRGAGLVSVDAIWQRKRGQ